MKKETMAKISALTLAAMLLTSCNNNPAISTEITTDTDIAPVTSDIIVSSTPVAPTTSEPAPACTCEPAVEKHIDFDFPNPVDYEIRGDEQIENVKTYNKYRYVALYEGENNQNVGVVHKYNTVFNTNTNKNKHYVLGCGKDNNSQDFFPHTYVVGENEFYTVDLANGSMDQFLDHTFYLCDKCFDEESDKKEMVEILDDSKSVISGSFSFDFIAKSKYASEMEK